VSRVIPYSESVSGDYLGWTKAASPCRKTLPELLSLYHCENSWGRQLTSWHFSERRRVGYTPEAKIGGMQRSLMGSH